MPRLVLFSVLFSLSSFTSFSANANENELQLTKMVTLSKSEPYFAQTIAGKYLYTGASKSADDNTNRVLVFDRTSLAAVKSLVIPHSPSFLYSLGTNKVLVVGKAYTDQWYTYFTTIDAQSAPNFIVKTTTVSPQFMVDQFAGNENVFYFSEPGTRAILQYKNGQMQSFVEGLSGLGPFFLSGNEFWVLERRSFEPGDEQIARVNIATKSITRVLPSLGQGISDVALIADKKLLVFNEWQADRLGFINTDSGSIEAQIDIKGGPGGLAQLRNCVAVSAFDGKRIDFVHLGSHKFTIVDSWDLSQIAGLNCAPLRMTADAENGRFFLRDINWCGSGFGLPAQLVALEQASQKTFDLCSKE